MSDLNPYEEGLAIDLATAQARIEELEAHCKRLRLEAAHANDTADAAIEQTKELEAALPEQVEWVKRLADDLNAAEGREARLKDKLEKVAEFVSKLEQYAIAIDDTHLHGKAFAALAELRSDLPVDKTRESQKGQDDE